MTEHPNEFVTAAYLDGALKGEALASVEAHLAECDSCRAGVALLVEDEPAEAPEIDEHQLDVFRKAAQAVARRRFPGARNSTWLLAAALVSVVAFVAYRVDRSEAPLPAGVERNSGTAPLSGLFPAAGSVVEASDLSFRFDAVQGADRYVIEVTDAMGMSVATFEVREPARSADWPIERSVPQGTLIWTLRAMSLDRVIEETRPIAFEIR